MSRVLTIEDFSYTGSPEPTSAQKHHNLTSHQQPQKISPGSNRLYSPELCTFIQHQPSQQLTPQTLSRDFTNARKDYVGSASENRVLIKGTNVKKNELPGGSLTPSNEKSEQIIKLYGSSFFRGKPESSNSPAYRSIQLKKTNTNLPDKSQKIEPKIELLENSPQEKYHTDSLLISLSPFARSQRKDEIKGSPKSQPKFFNFKQTANKVTYNDYTPKQETSKQQKKYKEEIRYDNSPSTAKNQMPQEWSLTTVDLGDGIKKKEIRLTFNDKAAEAMNREHRSNSLPKKLGPKTFNQSPLNINTPRELPPLNLNKMPEKVRAHSFTKPSLQGFSSRVLRVDTDEVSQNNDMELQGLSDRMKLLNFISVYNTQRLEKNTMDSIERSLKNGISDDTHMSNESSEARMLLQKLRESDEVKDKKGMLQAENKANENSNKKKEITIETKIKAPPIKIRSPKKVMTFTEGNSPANGELKKFRRSFQILHKHKDSARVGNDMQEDYIPYKKAASDPKNGSIPCHKVDLVKTKAKSLKHELTPEERYEKIMKSNIQDKFNEIFRSLRAKKKTKKVQFSCDFMK